MNAFGDADCSMVRSWAAWGATAAFILDTTANTIAKNFSDAGHAAPTETSTSQSSPAVSYSTKRGTAGE